MPEVCRNRKMECGTCGFIARASRGAVAKHGVPAHCGLPMRFADVEDQAVALPDQVYDHPDAQDEMRRWERAARRDARKLVHNGIRCGGCGAFIRSVQAHCGCGYVNDIRGGHDHGGWQTAAPSRAREEMPF
jgi:hypothetical protein